MNEPGHTQREAEQKKTSKTSRRVVLAGVFVIVTSFLLNRGLPEGYEHLKSFAGYVCALALGFTLVYDLTPPRNKKRR
jgi:hypothetical protein